MSFRVGFDGKFLSDKQNIGARSGHGVHSVNLINEMLKCKEYRSLTIFALDSETGIQPSANCQIVEMPRYARSSILRNAAAIPFELIRHPVDVLLSFSTLPLFVPCRSILLLADVFWLANPGWLPPYMAVLRTLALRRSAARADRIITTTEFSRKEISRLLSVPADRIVVVPHGVRPRFAIAPPSSAIDSALARHGITESFIFTLNDIHPRKNLEGLIAAYEALRARTGLRHQLVIAGRNLWPYPEFFRRVQNSLFREDIKVLGYVSSDDVLALYRGASLFVYPSFYEGWGLQVHEAMMAGTPTAIADNSSMPEIAGDAADTFDPYDIQQMSCSMERVLTDTVWRETLIARGFKQVNRYSWQKAAEATLSVCADVVASNRRS